MKREYEEIEPVDRKNADAALLRNNPEELALTVLAVALHESELAWAQNYCFRLANHDHFNVRGNAILGLGHLARIHGSLDVERAAPIINDGLKDSNEYVQAQARSAADDIESFLDGSLQLTRIYIELAGEGTHVWRPIEARHLRDDLYHIPQEVEVPEDEEWLFEPGDTVRCQEREFSDKQFGLVALEKVVV